MSTCVFSLMCMLVLSGDVRAQQQPDPPQPPTSNYTCTGTFVYGGAEHTVTGAGDTCPDARWDFYQKAMKIIIGTIEQQVSDGAIDDVEPIPDVDCKCEDRPLTTSEPRYEVICTCITCDGYILYGRAKGATIREASNEVNMRINLMLKAAGWRACTRNCCAVPIPKTSK